LARPGFFREATPATWAAKAGRPPAGKSPEHQPALHPARLLGPIRRRSSQVVYLLAAPGPLRWHYRQKINALVYQAMVE
jgi:hypothetical protein